MTTVAVIGLGAMGSRVARRFLDSGHDLVVWNRTPARMAPLVDLGVTAAASPADAATRAEVVITMVSDPDALRDVIAGQNGIAATIGASTTLVQMSTVAVDSASWVASALPAGTGLLDAPVLGSVSEAEAGTLSVFVGGPAELFDRWTPVLSSLGRLIHVGPLGAGTAAKLVANSTLLGTLGVFGEALALARGLGLSNDVAFEVLSGTPLAAQAERRRRSIETDDYPLRFRLSLAVKDAGLILEAAGGGGADLRLAKAARSWFADADEDGMGEQDYSAVIGYIKRSG